MPRKSLTKSEFVARASAIHDNKYDYSLVVYKNNKTKVKIICPVHGEFEQPPTNHLRNKGCKECVYDSLKSNTQEFIKESREIHGDTYIYSATTYSGCYSKVVIICYKHGNFEQIPYSHKQGRGCPVCSESKGEREIRMFLEKQNIKYTPQQTFDDCRNVFALPFDFYLPEYNMCIEYDGEQHYRPMGFAGGEKGFERTKRNDQIKDKYCNEQGVNLLRIRYDENIKEILKQKVIKIV